MILKLKSIAVVTLTWVGTTQFAFADLVVPEPGTLPLVGVAVVAAIYLIRRRK